MARIFYVFKMMHRNMDHLNTVTSISAQITMLLAEALEKKEKAVLALSGGGTPQTYLPELFKSPLDWARVQLILVDERWVPPDHPDSNERLIRLLKQGLPADESSLFSLWSCGEAIEKATRAANTWADSQKMEIDICLLGMGVDGHIASLFPNDSGLTNNDPYWISVAAPSSPNVPLPRISLSPKALLACRNILLIFSGSDKWRLWQSAETTNMFDMPVNIVRGHENLTIIPIVD